MFVLFLYWFLIPATAHAYIDPSSGSLVLQTTIGAVLSALFVVKLYWKRIRAWAADRLGGRRDGGGA